MLHGIRVSLGGLVEQFLKGAAVVQAAANLRHQFLRDVDGRTAPFDPAIQDVARMPFARETGPRRSRNLTRVCSREVDPASARSF